MGWLRRKSKEPAFEPVVEEERPIDLPPGEVVAFGPSGDVRLSIGTVPEAKLALKQLKLRKKELGIEKKALNNEMAMIRADRRASVANQGSKMRGGGEIGKFVRTMQTVSRDSARSSRARQLVPYEAQKAVIERNVLALDKAIMMIDSWLIERERKQEDEIEMVALPAEGCGVCGAPPENDDRFCHSCGAQQD